MSATVSAPPPKPDRGKRHKAVESTSTWSLLDRAGLAFAWAMGLLLCAICAAIIIYVAVQGIRFLRPEMLWTNPKTGYNQSETGGILEPILGSLLATTIAIVVATPLGVAIAVWLSEYGRPSPLARVVESSIEMLAGTPSVVLAIFGLLLFRQSFLEFLSSQSGAVVYGKSVLTASAMLALLGLPLIVVQVREGLRSIPNHVREASYGLGKTKAATIRRVLLPAVRPQTITGAMLAAGHVIGDTAIILFLLGDTPQFDKVGSVPVLNVLRSTSETLTSFVYDNAPTGDLNQPQKAWAAAFVLLLIVLIVNLVINRVGRRSKDLRWN
jgi:phosphate transport system permease protein